jgi:hypothetical protein
LLPTQQRSASDGLFSVARGSRLPLDPEKAFARFFIYWEDIKKYGRNHSVDLDLSATFLDEDFRSVGRVDWTALKGASVKDIRFDKLYAVHSGDFVKAPKGACEFIDIDIDKAKDANQKARYVAMTVYSYSGQSFAELDKCYAGWMSREQAARNAIYDPKTVECKLNVKTDSKNVMVCILDLEERKFIWVDLNYASNRSCRTAMNTRATTEQISKGICNIDNKMSVYDLLEIHCKTRCDEIVEDKDDADVVYDFNFGFEVNKINSEYLV